MPLYEVDYSYDTTHYEVTDIVADNPELAFELAQAKLDDAFKDEVISDLTIEGVRTVNV